MSAAAPPRERAAASGRPAARRLSPSALKALTTAHVAASVALLGATGATLVLGLSGLRAGDAAAARTTYELMQRLVAGLAIPLSAIALATGVWLSLRTRWSIRRNGWVLAKLVLLLAVIVVGAAWIGPAVEGLVAANEAAGAGPAAGGDGWRPVAGAGFDVAALVLATGLSVYKPRRRRAAG